MAPPPRASPCAAAGAERLRRRGRSLWSLPPTSPPSAISTPWRSPCPTGIETVVTAVEAAVGTAKTVRAHGIGAETSAAWKSAELQDCAPSAAPLRLRRAAPGVSRALRRSASPTAPATQKKRISDRARYARAKAEGRLAGPKAERFRQAARASSRRRYWARAAAGLCVKCGVHRSQEGRSRCGSCLGCRNAAERRQWVSRLAAGRCGACGDPAPEGRARCERCSAMQAGRPSRKAYARKVYARRRARNTCVDCAAPSPGAARCPSCARQSYIRSGQHRGLPAGAPTFFVIEIDTGATLSEWETLAEARASVAFARIDPDTVTIEADIPMMATMTSW